MGETPDADDIDDPTKRLHQIDDEYVLREEFFHENPQKRRIYAKKRQKTPNTPNTCRKTIIC
jgi:hypothetical protein